MEDGLQESICIAVVFKIAKKWNKSMCPPIVEWIMKIRYMYAMEFIQP